MNNMSRVFAITVLIVAGTSSLFAQWVQTNGPAGGSVTCFATSGSNLFAGTLGHGVFLSTNNGTNWTVVNTGLTNDSVYVLAVSGSNLFAATLGGVFLSANNGTTWTAVNNGLKNLIVDGLGFSGPNLFAGTAAGVFLSTNNGSSWTAVNNGLTNTMIVSLTTTSTGVFVGTTNGVFLSTNNGTNWTAANAGMSNMVVNALAVTGTTIFAGTYGDVAGGVFLSTNNGSSWTLASNGLTSTNLNALVFSGTSLFAGTDEGVYLSTNNGTSWTSVSTGLSNNAVWGLAVAGTDLFAGTGTAAWRRPLLEMVGPLPTPPTISSFTPTSGPIGTAVTITGKNFNTIADKNVVYFGPLKATVAAATSTSLTVSVPGGATYARISVTDTTTHLSALSAQVFTVTFASSRTIDASSFASPISFPTGSGPDGVAFGDLDEDGRADIVIANANSASISIFRNTGTPGSITSSSFASKVDLTVGAYPSAVAICDVDGDGRLDIISVNDNSSTISVFRNISTQGSLTANSFAPKVDFVTASGPFRLAFGDLDGDGKLDLAVTCVDGGDATGNTISVFRSTSIPGIVSFAPRVDLSTSGTDPQGIAICDMDGDGKPDMVVAIVHKNVVAVFRNVGTPGTITASSFAPEVDFSTTQYPFSVVVGDIDGDGKPDIAVSNTGGPGFPNSSTVSIFRNTGTPGSISPNSFAPRTDFTTGVWPYALDIADLDGDGKPDLVVTSYYNDVSLLKNRSTSGNIDFAAKVDYTTAAQPGYVAVGDVDGDGKPDIVVLTSPSSNALVYRNALSSGSLSGWTSQVSPLANPSFGGIQFVSSTEGWVEAGNGQLIHTTNAGSTWSAVNACGSDTVAVISDPSRSMSFGTASNGWIIGSLGSFNATKGAVLYHTTNSGASWIRQLLTSWSVGLFVQFVDANNGWAAVGNGTGPNNITSGALIHTTNGGASWATLSNSPPGIPFFVDANNGWSFNASPGGVAVSYIWHTTDGGATWSTQLTDSTSAGFLALQFVDLNNGWVVGGSGKVLRTTNGGTTWTRIANTGNSSGHKAMFFLNPNVGWIGGRLNGDQGPGIILHTTNGGGAWSIQNLPLMGDMQQDIFCIYFADANHGWFTSDYGGFARTTSGGEVTDVYENHDNDVPSHFALSQNYPNPFNPTTAIRYQLSASSFVTLRVFDILGREVATLVNEMQSAGTHTLRWDGSAQPSGVYFYRLQAGNLSETRKLVLLR